MKFDWADYLLQAQSGNPSGKQAHTQVIVEQLSAVWDGWATVH